MLPRPSDPDRETGSRDLFYNHNSFPFPKNQTCRSGPTNIWFDHLPLVINYALLGRDENLKS